MTKQQEGVLNAMREFLWLGVCYNDHNFRPEDVAQKCRDVCKELGIRTADDGNRVLDKFARDLEQQEKT